MKVIIIPHALFHRISQLLLFGTQEIGYGVLLLHKSRDSIALSYGKMQVETM